MAKSLVSNHADTRSRVHVFDVIGRGVTVSVNQRQTEFVMRLDRLVFYCDSLSKRVETRDGLY